MKTTTKKKKKSYHIFPVFVVVFFTAPHAGKVDGVFYKKITTTILHRTFNYRAFSFRRECLPKSEISGFPVRRGTKRTKRNE